MEETVSDAVFTDRNEARRHTSAVPGVGRLVLIQILANKDHGAMKSPLLGLGDVLSALRRSLLRSPSRSHGGGPLCKPGRVAGVAPGEWALPMMAAGVRGSAGPSSFDCGWKEIRSVGSLRTRWGVHAGGTAG